MTKIWTLDTRDTVLLDVVMAHDNLSFADLGPDLRQLHSQTVEMLAAAGVRYEDLRTALVPHTKTEDIALVFDSRTTGSTVYGMDCAEQVLPLLDKEWRGSILCGDLIHHDQDRALELLQQGMACCKPVEVSNTCELYAIYLSNLTTDRVKKLLVGLLEYPSFLGYIRGTYDTPERDWLSTTLVNTYTKLGGTFIGKHEDDLETHSDRNLGWWPLDESDYKCVSIPGSLHFDLFLSYKVGRAVFPGFESDTIHGLSTISSDPRAIENFSIYVDQRKLAYLKEAKTDNLERAGLAEVTVADLEAQIAARIRSNYIYELSYMDDHKVSKFNTLLEFRVPDRDDPVKMMAGMAYEPDDHRLRLITLF